MNFFGILVPIIVNFGQQMAKITSLGFNATSGKLIYRAAEGANGIKTLATTEDLENLGGGSASPYFVGQIVDAASNAFVPNGFIPLNGANLSKTTYGLLYSIYGDMHNDDSTPSGYFKLPDSREKYLLYDPNIAGSTGTGVIVEGNLPVIKPKLKVFDGTAGSPDPNYLAVISDGSTSFNGYSNESNAEIDILTPFGAEEPVPYYPPYYATLRYIYSGVLF